MAGFILVAVIVALVLVSVAIAYRLAFWFAKCFGRRNDASLSLEIPDWGNAFATVVVLGIYLALCSELLDWIQPAFQPVLTVQVIFSIVQVFLCLLITWLMIRWEHKLPSSLAALTAVLFVAMVKSCQLAGLFLVGTAFDRMI